MSDFEKLMKAKTLLGLHDKSSLLEIKSRYRALMHLHHPDQNPETIDSSTKMSSSINDAYETIMKYINSYEYSFDEESIQKTCFTPDEWWRHKFGPDNFNSNK